MRDKTFLILAYPSDSSLSRENIQHIKKILDKVAPKKATGIMLITEKFVASGFKEFPLLSGMVIAIILLILFIDLKNLKNMMIVFIPLVFGGTIAMGIICMSGATISILMLTAFPLIFGIGIDDGVHIFHRYKETGDIVKAVSHTGRAIFLTTVTTLVGFGALLFTNHNGLIGTGLLIGIGVALCFIFSITILPATLALLEKHGSIC